MNILFTLYQSGAYRFFDGVVRELTNSGNEVTVLVPPDSSGESSLKHPDVTTLVGDEEGVELGRMRLRRDWWSWLLLGSRALRNYALYLKPEHPSPHLAHRPIGFLPGPMRLILASRPGKRVVASRVMQTLLIRLEKLAPPDPNVISDLLQRAPDVVVASAYIRGWCPELEYVKAAKSLNIPTVVPVLSWDHLTTKGVFHIVPDVTCVWNRMLAEEAQQLHSVPSEKIVVTGAPVFDAWFDTGPTLDRTSFCRQVGLDSSRPFVVYLCSSPTIAGDESWCVTELSKSLRETAQTKGVSILVRPHPLNARIWDGFSEENIVVWPEGGEVPETPESKGAYYDTVFHSEAVVGVNTSALVEAAIVDKPCVTIVTERYRSTQAGLGHFRHLLEGAFLEQAHGFPEAAVTIAAILQGRDSKATARRRFVKDFVRPWGTDIPSAQIMATAIDRAARGEAVDESETAGHLDRNMGVKA